VASLDFASVRRRVGTRWVWAVGSLPLAGLVLSALTDRLGANPVETVTHATGDWALRFLWLCLAVTPARLHLGWSALAPYRRPLGLLAFGYASLHFATFLVLDLALDPAALGEELAERPYITAGFTAFALMTPLAATSTRASIRRLGRRWAKLHRLVYAAAVAAAVHFWWLVKADVFEPLVYAAVLAVLLAARWIPPARRGRRGGGAAISSDRASA
jgi:sulfoxide reductase heme-binding subunit YedZ